MPRNSIVFVLFCALFLSTLVISQSKFRKLESMLNILQTKLTMLENKVFEDELDFRAELDTLLKELNATKENNQDKMGKLSEAGLTSANEDELLQVLEKVRRFQDGFGKEKQYIRSQLNLFEVTLDDTKSKQANAMSELVEESDKRLANVENKVSAGKQFINKIGEDMRNEIIFINQNISKDVEIVSILQKAMDTEMQELKQEIAENKVTIADLSDKLENIQNAVNKINEAPFLECGTWDRFGLSCYKVFDDEVEWEDAVANCRLEDAYLTEVDSSSENSYVVNLTKTRNIHVNEALIENYEYDYGNFLDLLQTDDADRNIGPWLGASDIQTEGKWIWEYSGRNLDKAFQGWNDGEPNGGTRENCLYLHEQLDYKWNDIPCDEKKPYVCEKPVTVK